MTAENSIHSSTTTEEAFAAFLATLAERGKTPKHKWDKYFYDPEAAERAVHFIENYLIFVEGPPGVQGYPFRLQPWQKRIVRKLFGWRRWADGTRRYRYFFLFIPKKNGKTSLVAAIANYAAYADNEPAPHIACVAADKEQAGEIFKMISEQVKANPTLLRRSKVYKRSLFIPKTLGSIRVLSKQPGGKHGPNWHMVISDECHAIQNGETVDALEAGVIARRQPLVCKLSTAGHDRTHWFYREYEYAKSVRDGTIPRDDYLVIIYEADPEKWKEESEWFKANPNLGVTIELSNFRAAFDKASQLPSEENKFKRLNLNIWTEGENKCIPMDRWRKCVYPTFDVETLRGKPCYVGLDLAATTDFAAAALVFPPDDDERPFWDVLLEFWYPEGNIELRKKKLGGFDITPWADKGHITLTPGEVIDYKIIRNRLNELSKIYKFKDMAIDDWEATETATRLDEDGFTVSKVRLGYKTMNFPTKFMLGLVASLKINHHGHPVLTWMAGNLQTEEDPAGNLKPSKRRSKEKIDGMVALILGISRAAVAPEQKKRFQHGARVLG